MGKSIINLGKYVDFTTDFGMKLYFGKENKDVLIAFLNDLFAGEKVIEDLVYLETEHDRESKGDWCVLLDLHCKGAEGEFFIIEMQQLEEGELDSDMERWSFLLKDMSRLNQLPKFSDKQIFSCVFQVGEVAKLNEDSLMKYEARLKHRRDAEAVYNTARREGWEEGRREVAELRNHELVGSLISGTDFDDVKIASLVVVDVSYVQQVRTELSKKN